MIIKNLGLPLAENMVLSENGKFIKDEEEVANLFNHFSWL